MATAMEYHLYIRYHPHWDQVAVDDTASSLASFAWCFPGHKWEIRNDQDEVVMKGETHRGANRVPLCGDRCISD